MESIITNNLCMPLALTVIAGLSTGVGSIIAVVKKKLSSSFFSVSLGFSAGIIIFVSLVELYDSARKSLSAVTGNDTA